MKRWTRRLVSEPLLHFAAAGVAIFMLYGWIAPTGSGLENDVIVVDRGALLTHLQYRTRAFEPRVAGERLAALDGSELEQLIQDYVREEALHREALSLGMDGNDYVIKRRLIQKVEFLAGGLAEAGIQLGDAALQNYLKENSGDYWIEPAVTFTHVFFDAERRGDKPALAEATRKRDALNTAGTPFHEAPRHGDRFPYHVNYVERTPHFVASHFGEPMAREIFALAAGDGVWHGPYRSAYGAHVVLVARSEPGRAPELDEIRGRVADDAQRAAVRELQDAALDEIVARYEVQRQYTATPPRLAYAR